MSNPIRHKFNPQRPSPNSSTISKPPSLKNLSENFSTAVSIHSSKGSLDSEAPKNESEFNWQEKKTTLKARFSHLFNNETLADVHFIVGTDELRIPAHKLGEKKILIFPNSTFFKFFLPDQLFLMQCSTVICVTQNRKWSLQTSSLPPSSFSCAFFTPTSQTLDLKMSWLHFTQRRNMPFLPWKISASGFWRITWPPTTPFCFLGKSLKDKTFFFYRKVFLTFNSQARIFSEEALAERCMECIDQSTEEALAGDGKF